MTIPGPFINYSPFWWHHFLKARLSWKCVSRGILRLHHNFINYWSIIFLLLNLLLHCLFIIDLIHWRLKALLPLGCWLRPGKWRLWSTAVFRGRTPGYYRLPLFRLSGHNHKVFVIVFLATSDVWLDSCSLEKSLLLNHLFCHNISFRLFLQSYWEWSLWNWILK